MIDPQQLFSLKGRTALVTGGSRGIGRMIAEGYVRSGARVYISARKAEACDATAKELSALGHCVSLPGDVSTLEGVHALVAAYRQHEQTLDILVNNAGAAWGAPYAEFPESGWDKALRPPAGARHAARAGLGPRNQRGRRRGDGGAGSRHPGRAGAAQPLSVKLACSACTASAGSYQKQSIRPQRSPAAESSPARR